MRRALAAYAVLMLVVAGCGSDADGEAPVGADSIAEVADATASCMQEAGFETALTAEIFVAETEETFPATDAYSVLAVTDDGRDVQVMLFAEQGLAAGYVEDATSDGDRITRERVAGGRAVVESGFRVEDGKGLEEPIDADRLATIESCVTGAGL